VTPSPFQQLLGPGFAQLPAPVRRLHSLPGNLVTAGQSDIVAGRGLFAWLIARLAGMPAPGAGVPVTVAFEIDGKGGEFWRRRFARRRYQSGFAAGTGRHAGLLRERFFPFTFYHRLTPGPQGLRWDVAACSLLGVPLPRWARPHAVCFEGGDGDRFTFDIDASFPLIGQVIHYRGWLLPQDRQHD
jgi:hypothetical protein